MKDIVIQWASMWRYDYWFRQKYKLPFDSDKHRAANQIDIKFEYVESHIAEQEFSRHKQEREREKEMSKKREDELFEMISI